MAPRQLNPVSFARNKGDLVVMDGMKDFGPHPQAVGAGAEQVPQTGPVVPSIPAIEPTEPVVEPVVQPALEVSAVDETIHLDSSEHPSDLIPEV